LGTGFHRCDEELKGAVSKHFSMPGTCAAGLSKYVNREGVDAGAVYVPPTLMPSTSIAGSTERRSVNPTERRSTQA
jgi:hypothetical protein